MSRYLRYPLSYRDIEELLLERGLEVDHSTVNRWVLAYALLIERRLRPFRKAHCGSMCVGEIYVRMRVAVRHIGAGTAMAIDVRGIELWDKGKSKRSGKAGSIPASPAPFTGGTRCPGSGTA